VVVELLGEGDRLGLQLGGCLGTGWRSSQRLVEAFDLAERG